MRIDTKTVLKSILAILAGMILLWVPLLGDYHIESAMLGSFIGSYWGALAACRNIQTPAKDFYTALRIAGWIYLAGVPLIIYSLMTGCLSVHGIGFWLLLPLPGVFFGYSVGRLLRIWKIPFPKFLAVGILTTIAAGVFLVEFFNLPQVYFFNHVWGGWPGPIYDEVIVLTGSFFYFRMLTGLWTLLLWYVPVFNSDRLSRVVVLCSAGVLALGYAHLAEMGIVSPQSWIRHRLSDSLETKNFTLYYDDEYFTRNEITRIGFEHEFYLDRIAGILKLSEPPTGINIESYIYAHAWQKKQLTGAKFTSYVPVWLEQDQLHIARGQLEGSLEHELVHVLAKQFGNRLFNASWSIGLVEGLATAVSGGDSDRSTVDQMVASDTPYPGKEEMQRALSPLGFYGGRSGVNYTTAGSFVRYLLDTYPAQNFKRAYANGDIAGAYPDGWNQLIAGWHQRLDSMGVDSVDRHAARRLFGIPSLFEQECPHVTGSRTRLLDRYRFHLADYDTAEALDYLDRLKNTVSGEQGIRAEWLYRNLVEGNIGKVLALQDEREGQTSVERQLLEADALRLDGRFREAEKNLDQAIIYLAQHPDSVYDAAVAVRLDSVQWNRHLELTYRNRLFNRSLFKELYYRTKIRSVERAIVMKRWKLLKAYAGILLEMPFDTEYFSTYTKLIHYLAYTGETGLAQQWIKQLQATGLRLRYRDMLEKEQEWIQFIQSYPVVDK